MTTAKPLISVIIPTFNGAGFLSEAVESIRQQDYKPLEIIIVDDGSTDNTADLVSRLGEDIHYLYQSNRGPAAARNMGIASAQGELIAFLDADDLWPSDKLRIQVGRLLDDPELAMVLGQIQTVRLPGAPDFAEPGADQPTINVHLGSGVFRKSTFERVGLFDETLRYSEDHDWFLRAREQGVSVAFVTHVTLYYRLHEKNMTKSKEAGGWQLTQVLKKSLDRRRQNSRGPIRSLPKLTELDPARESDTKASRGD